MNNEVKNLLDEFVVKVESSHMALINKGKELELNEYKKQSQAIAMSLASEYLRLEKGLCDNHETTKPDIRGYIAPTLKTLSSKLYTLYEHSRNIVNIDSFKTSGRNR